MRGSGCWAPPFWVRWKEGWSQGATSLGCRVPRVPPHRDGVAPHRGQPDPVLLHAAPRPRGTAWPAQHAGGCRTGPSPSWVGVPCLLSPPAVPDRPATLRTTTMTGRGVPRTTLRPSGSRWTPEGPPSSRASSPRAATPASSKSTRLTGTWWGQVAPGTALSPIQNFPVGLPGPSPAPPHRHSSVMAGRFPGSR